MIQEAIEKILRHKDLSKEEMFAVMQEIMTGSAQTPQIVSFLTGLSLKGESIEEITAAVQVMRRFAVKINTKQKPVLDTCGTGGDKKGTFNISTISAFVASGSGIAVAKHGNRSVSSCCGSADILEALGVNINMSPESLERCLDETGIVFLFAQNLHPAMKYAMTARKQIGAKTMFNILGPLSNPAAATNQLIGVYDGRWTEPLARVLKNLGTTHALVVFGEDGLDEITTAASTRVTELRKGRIRNYKISPEDFGLKKARPQDLSGGDIASNADIMLDVLRGKAGPGRDIAVLNAAAAIYAADKVSSIAQGIELAEDSINSGRALEKLELLREYSKK